MSARGLRTLHLYMVRHGETAFNRERLLQGQSDIPLNDLGKAQAGKAAGALKEIPFEKVFASDLKRAYETAEIIVKGHSVLGSLNSEDVLLKRPSARERGFGVMEGASVQVFWEKAKAANVEPPWKYTPEGGESPGDVRERAKKFTDEMFAEMKTFFKTKDDLKAEDVTKVLLVSHGGFLQELVTHFVERWRFDMQYDYRKIPQNCSVSQFRFLLDLDETSGSVTGSVTEVECIKMSDEAHLQGLDNLVYSIGAKPV